MYYEVKGVGVLVVRAVEDVTDARGRLMPETLSLRDSKLLDRLADDQTAMPQWSDEDDATPYQGE